MVIMLRSLGYSFVGLFGICLFTSCVKDPITGKQTFVLIEESEEIAMGRKVATDVDKSMGLYVDRDLTDYVEQLGGNLANSSERPHLPWQFRIIDSPVANAFALPGGYIYLTRGILGYITSEAALVGILGHEVGHVTARHHVEALSKQQLARFGIGVGGIFSSRINSFANAFNSGLGLLFLKFGRDAERESDRLAVQYLLSNGYDPKEIISVLHRLQKISGTTEGVPSWLSTHPTSSGRIDAILEQLRNMAVVQTGLSVKREAYLKHIDGLVFGENPREGFMRGSRFYHPNLQFQIDYPQGWAVRNTPEIVYVVEPDGGGIIQLTHSIASSDVTPLIHGQRFFRKNDMEYGTGEQLQEGPFPIYRAPFRKSTRTQVFYGQGGFILDGVNAYEIIGLTRDPLDSRYRSLFNAVIESFDRLRNQSDLSIQPLFIRIVEIEESLTLEQVFRQKGIEPDLFNDAAMLNNLSLSDLVSPGDLVKILTRGLT